MITIYKLIDIDYSKTLTQGRKMSNLTLKEENSGKISIYNYLTTKDAFVVMWGKYHINKIYK